MVQEVSFPAVHADRADRAVRAVRPIAERPPVRSLRERVAELHAMKDLLREGDVAATHRQHARGKLTVRERLDLLLDPDSFTEIEPLRRHRSTGLGMDRNRPHTDGVVTGWGRVYGRTVLVYAHDFRIFGGALGEAHAEKIHKVMDLALSTGVPLISLADGAGARIQEGVTALAGYGGIFRRNVQASGVVPQISVILGPAAGGAAYSPALTDFVFVVRGAGQLYITGPDVVEAVTGEPVTHEALGGADVHGSLSGVATHVYDDEESCLEDVRYLVSMLPANNAEEPPLVACTDPVDRSCEKLLDLVPAEPGRVYDVRQVIEEIVDDGEHFEYQAHWATNIVCSLTRIAGATVGVVANQPAVQAGVLDIAASEKAARFVQFCDAFHIPLVTLVDVPGFLPGTDQEHRGIIRHGARLLFAYCNATVPRVQVILRKAYGGAYIVMDSRSIGCDLSFAWPGNEVAVMGAEGAVNVLHRRALAVAEDPDALRADLTEEYRTELMHPFYAAERGLVDDLIDPSQTRRTVAGALALLRTKAAPPSMRKHANPPMR